MKNKKLIIIATSLVSLFSFGMHVSAVEDNNLQDNNINVVKDNLYSK